MINLNDNKSKRTHWVLFFTDGNTTAYFDSFGTEYIPQEVLNKIKEKYITQNIFRIESDDSIVYGFYYKNLSFRRSKA